MIPIDEIGIGVAHSLGVSTNFTKTTARIGPLSSLRSERGQRSNVSCGNAASTHEDDSAGIKPMAYRQIVRCHVGSIARGIDSPMHSRTRNGSPR